MKSTNLITPLRNEHTKNAKMLAKIPSAAPKLFVFRLRRIVLYLKNGQSKYMVNLNNTIKILHNDY